MRAPRRRWRLPRWRLPQWRLRPPRTRRSAAALALGCLALLWWFGGRGERRCWPSEQVLDAIRFVESSHRDAVPDGDDGRAIGPFQIHREYWQDALKAEPSLGGSYQDCRRRDYAERIVAAYMRRWVPDAWAAGDAEVLARVHNGGPKGAQNPATLGYWARVRERLP
ncbi:MAG TPA: hypothetical protein VFZ65_00215 [Planctomycetota bacterium]|nr:hypothetical protein [Planctomycetota bacterium]